MRRQFLQEAYGKFISPGPEGVLSPKLYVDVPARPQKFDFLYTNFSHNYPPIDISLSKEKHPLLLKLGAFTIICSKYTHQFM